MKAEEATKEEISKAITVIGMALDAHNIKEAAAYTAMQLILGQNKGFPVLLVKEKEGGARGGK